MKPVHTFAVIVLAALATLSLMAGCVASKITSSAFASDGLEARLQAEEAIALVRAFCVQEKTPLSQFDEVRARFLRSGSSGSWLISLHFSAARKQEVRLTDHMIFTVDDRSGKVAPVLQY